MPFSNQEQHILHEMEVQLAKHSGRRAQRSGSQWWLRKPLFWSIGLFVVGFILVLSSFTTSLVVATLGVLLMCIAPYLWLRARRQT